MKLKKGIKLIIVLILIFGIFLYLKDITKDKDAKTTFKSSESNVAKYAKKNNFYDDKYKNEYKDIVLVEQNNFKDIVKTFLEKGYSGKEINYILKLSNKNIQKLKSISYQSLDNYYNIANFNVDNTQRYNKYKENNPKYDYKDIVTRVNINLDLPVYTDTKTASDGNDLLVLVNKYNSLPKGYSPSDLVYVSGAYGNEVPFRSVLKESFEKLQKAMKDEVNVEIKPTTAYRSEAFQTTLYNNYVAKDGKEKADTYSARPGFSEHQTGLAIDLKNTALNNARLTDENYKWLEENCYKYGFIIRFPKDKEDITGYQFENWHIRYVGLEAAKKIHNENITLEEYIDLYVAKY